MADKQGGKHVGSIVMWSLNDPHVPEEDLKKLFVQQGLDWDTYGPRGLDAEITFHKALNEAKSATSGWRFVTLFDGQEKKVIGVVQESVDKAAEDVKYRTDWTTDAVKLILDKTNAKASTTNNKHEVAKVFIAACQKLQAVYTKPDFTRFLVRNLRETGASTGGALQLRPTGGTYFIPAQDYQFVLQHKAIIEGCGSEFGCFNIKEDDVSVRDLGRSAMTNMTDELHKLEAELVTWAEELPRTTTLQRRFDAYKALKAKAEMYASMLSIKADDILTGLSACTKKAKELLGLAESKTEEKAAEVKPIKVEEEVKQAKVQRVVVKAQAQVKTPIKKVMKDAEQHKAEAKKTKKARKAA